MRTFTNEKRIRRNRKLSQIVTIVTLIVLGGSLALSIAMSPEQQMSMVWLYCVIVPVGFVGFILSLYMTNQWLRYPHPEEVLTEALKGLGNNYTFYNYYLPAYHVVVAPRGVFAITTRFQTGEFFVKGSRWRSRDGIVARLFRFVRQEGLGNPMADAKQAAGAVQEWLNEILPEANIEVEPVVAFIAENVTIEAEDPDVPVVYADTDRTPNLHQHITETVRAKDRRVLTRDDRQAIEEAAVQEDEE